MVIEMKQEIENLKKWEGSPLTKYTS
jgi:hypothetical protein